MISRSGVKMNLRIITKNHASYPEIRFLTKSILKPYDRATAMPQAWELKVILEANLNFAFYIVEKSDFQH